jgi:integrase
MGRRAEGWKIVWRNGLAYVRFTHAGTRHDIATGKRDGREAAEEAGRLYSEVVSGRWQRGAGAPDLGPVAPLSDITASWLVALESTHGAKTIGTYTVYVGHWLLFFGDRFDAIHEASCGQYGRARLLKVVRDTVRKELAGLRCFLEWCREQRICAVVPVVPSLPKKSLGVRATKRKRVATDLTEQEVEAWLAQLPEQSNAVARKGPHRGRHFAVRAYFTFLWETGLRPTTVQQLLVGDHYRPGRATLLITAEVDKVRFGRELPLSGRARACLDQWCLPEGGPIFGVHDWREYVRPLAELAGLDPTKVATLSPYDLRHSRATDLLSKSGNNILGVGYMLGHKHATTTDIYAKTKQRHAEAVIESSGGNRWDSGEEATKAERPGSPVERLRALCLAAVRRRGLEPLRCYPLAPQGNLVGANAAKVAVSVGADECQNTTQSAITGEPHQNAAPLALRESWARPPEPRTPA